ncbi:hypothetical protein SAMN06265222_11598 [Neorhodopirellula lusitana]|uniref:Uncharacterized protein n=1 Tax=Neorhodopirellula lusitana TaxID=445327 RepID=A0ABY1QIU6_9BACT|nr:hypothetical protein SAMN06265222_11598 [Neorhodopirellula lusitana]
MCYRVNRVSIRAVGGTDKMLHTKFRNSQKPIASLNPPAKKRPFCKQRVWQRRTEIGISISAH